MDTLAILTQKYQEFNTQYFSGKLPLIPIRWGKLKYATAHVGFQTVGIKGGAKRFHGGLHMVFSDKYDRGADTLFPVLLHEMIHVYIVAVLDDIVDNHGPVFLKLRKELSEKSGIDIPLKDQAGEFELKTPVKPLYIVLKYYRNTVGYAIISKTTIDAKKELFPSIFTRDAVEVRLVESEVWTRKAESTRVQRNLSYKTGFYIAKDDDLADLYDHSTLVWTNRIIKEDIEVWHGTPHDFQVFSLEHMGAGEGRQAFGWGLYFAQEKKVARYYQKKLSSRVLYNNQEVPITGPFQDIARTILDDDLTPFEAIRKEISDMRDMLSDEHWSEHKREQFQEKLKAFLTLDPKSFTVVSDQSGKLLNVTIPDGPYLDWDKTFKEQDTKTRKILRSMCKTYTGYLKHCIQDDDTGEVIYRCLGNYNRNNRRVANEDHQSSIDLFNAGILGIRYRDGLSRDDISGTNNFVIFSNKVVSIKQIVREDEDKNPVSIRLMTGPDIHAAWERDPTIQDRIRYIDIPRLIPSLYHENPQYGICAFLNGKIVGIAGLEQSPDDPLVIWAIYTSVDPEYRQRGIAKLLMQARYRYIRDNNLTLVRSSYTRDGEMYLKPFVDRGGEKTD